MDRVQVAAAEAALDAASRDRARAEDRAAESARSLARTVEQAALDAFRAKRLAFQVRDPSIRIAQASARGGFLRGQRDRLATELATLRSQPRPKATSILSKSPVARPAAQDECHFELRQDRITFIDLDKLMKLTKSDAQMRVRMSDRIGVVSSKVGPVGAFSLAYELAPRVRVNALAPGLVRTEFARVLWEREAEVAAHIPMGRIGEPDDIAPAALFLVSDAARWITGEVVVVDGGATSQPSGGVA